jgi:hypothetical protein
MSDRYKYRYVCINNKVSGRNFTIGKTYNTDRFVTDQVFEYYLFDDDRNLLYFKDKDPTSPYGPYEDFEKYEDETTYIRDNKIKKILE